MAFRTEAAVVLTLLAAAFAGFGQEFTFEVRHVHARKGEAGELKVTDRGISFQESGKHDEHSRDWPFAEIQRLELSTSRIRLVTYEDVRWQFGRDKEYLFDQLPAGMAEKLYPFLRSRLDMRFEAQIADKDVTPLWTVPAKMLRRRAGANGVLKVSADRIVFESPEASRTWRYADILSVTRESPLELTIVSLKQETRLQLKQALPESRYNELWRRITEAGGLKPFQSILENHHD